MKKYLLILFLLSLALSACTATAPDKDVLISLGSDGSAAIFTARQADATVKEVIVKRSDVGSQSSMLVSIDGGESFLVTFFPYTLATGISASGETTLNYDETLWEVKAE